MVSPGSAPDSAAESWAAVATSTVRPVGLGLGLGGVGLGPVGVGPGPVGAGVVGVGLAVTVADGVTPEQGEPLTVQLLGLPRPFALYPNPWVPPAGTVAL